MDRRRGREEGEAVEGGGEGGGEGEGEEYADEHGTMLHGGRGGANAAMVPARFQYAAVRGSGVGSSIVRWGWTRSQRRAIESMKAAAKSRAAIQPKRAAR